MLNLSRIFAHVLRLQYISCQRGRPLHQGNPPILMLNASSPLWPGCGRTNGCWNSVQWLENTSDWRRFPQFFLQSLFRNRTNWRRNSPSCPSSLLRRDSCGIEFQEEAVAVDKNAKRTNTHTHTHMPPEKSLCDSWIVALCQTIVTQLKRRLDMSRYFFPHLSL